jgi:anti-sigma factor RsiW
MPQNQEEIEAKLAAYIDGELDAAGRAEIEKHLQANPQHRVLISDLTKQRELVRSLPRTNAPAEIAISVVGKWRGCGG